LVALITWGRRKGFIVQLNNDEQGKSQRIQIGIIGLITVLTVIFRIQAFWLLLLFLASYGVWLTVTKLQKSFTQATSLNFKKIVLISLSIYLALLFFTSMYLGGLANFSL
jgi:hypothetical protein|tara:strand:- start:1727 stop:2056 length:330 start_codon:yes stop_codon:yes gene_type:complete